MPLNTVLTFRLDEENLQQFNKRCTDLRKTPHATLRELMSAFTEGRITIHDPAASAVGDLYKGEKDDN